MPATADVEAGQALIEAEGAGVRDGDHYTKDCPRDAGGRDPRELRLHRIHAPPSTWWWKQLQRAGIDARSVPVENSVFWGEGPAFRRLRDDLFVAQLRVGQRALGVDGPLYGRGRWCRWANARPGFNNTRALGHGCGGGPLFRPSVKRDVLDAAGRSDDPYRWSQRPTPVSRRGKCHFIPLVQAFKLHPFQHDLLGGLAVERQHNYNHPFFHWKFGAPDHP